MLSIRFELQARVMPTGVALYNAAGGMLGASVAMVAMKVS
jgi:hypothetical protein